jgi:hypothetical protein
MDVYRQGATGRLAAYVACKYKGHRCIPKGWLTEITKEYESKFLEPVQTGLTRVQIPVAPGARAAPPAPVPSIASALAQLRGRMYKKT